MEYKRLWTIRDKYGNDIYLTEERWQHIIEDINHPDMANYMTELKDTIRFGNRKQDPLNPQKYRYTKKFDSLEDYNTHIVSVVLCRFNQTDEGFIASNNFIVTAYQKEVG